MTSTDTIGARIKYWRMRRGGMSQTVLAGLAGVSQAYISQVEAGRKNIERRATLVSVAKALRVTVADLLGEPGDPTNPVKAAVAEHVPEIRVAVAELLAGERPPSSRSERELAIAVDSATELLAACDYSMLAPQLPALLMDAAQYPRILTKVAFATSSMLRPVGYRDLAWHVADLVLAAAEKDGDPAVVGRARYQYLQCQPLESSAATARMATRIADGMQDGLGHLGVRRAYGMLHLRAGLSSAIAGKASDVADHIAAAGEQAALAGEPTDSDYESMSFGPTNVGLWHMAALNELGEYGRVVEIARGLHPGHLPAAGRAAAYWVDLGCALAQLRNRERDAIVAFLNAERSAPEWVRPQPRVRETVQAMIRRAQHRSVADDLRQLAQRIGIYRS